MGRNINSNKLTKEYILSKVSQVTIFATYLNLSDNVVQYCIDSGKLICSPIRDDKHPTCGFRYNNKGKLKFKDFGNDAFWGDCFDIVALVMTNMYNKPYNISNKQDFIKVLRHITLTFKDIFYGQEKDINLINAINTTIVEIKNKKPIIELVIREWNKDDKDYWARFGVPLGFLNVNLIYPIEQYYINRNVNPEPRYYYDKNDPCYGYYLGKDKNNIDSIKLYFPRRKHSMTRFITNCNHLEGIYGLDRNDYDIIVITKSTKDRVSIASNLLKFLYGGNPASRHSNNSNIGIINIPHETYRLRQNEYDWLNGKLKDNGIIVSLMDRDTAGMREAIWLRDNYNILPLLIPKEYNVKDFSEFVESNSNECIKNLIINTINYLINNNGEDSKLIGNQTGSDVMPF